MKRYLNAWGLSLSLKCFCGLKLFLWTFPYKEKYFALYNYSILLILEGIKKGKSSMF